MHILLIHQAFTALYEPGGTRHHELGRYLVQQGHRVTVIASPVSYLTGKAQGERIPWVDRQQVDEQITILRAYTYAALHRSFIHRMISFLSFMFSSFVIGLGIRDVDLVWGTSPPIFQGLTAWGLSRLKRVPFLFEVRDLWPAFAVAVGVLRHPILIRASEWLEQFLYHSADQIIVNSPGFIEHVGARGAQQIELIPNGADPRMFDPEDDGSAFRTIHNLQDKFVALYAGAHGMSNDLNIILEAANLLRNHHEIVFVLLGDGKEKLALTSRAAELDLDNVLFLPPVPKSSIPGALAAANVCIAILKPIDMYKTVYPNKVFDYMAAGRPVILAIDGVIREVVENARAGIIVPPGEAQSLANAVIKLSKARQSGIDMGLRGHQYIKDRFDRADLAKRLLLVIEGMR